MQRQSGPARRRKNKRRAHQGVKEEISHERTPKACEGKKKPAGSISLKAARSAASRYKRLGAGKRARENAKRERERSKGGVEAAVLLWIAVEQPQRRERRPSTLARRPSVRLSVCGACRGERERGKKRERERKARGESELTERSTRGERRSREQRQRGFSSKGDGDDGLSGRAREWRKEGEEKKEKRKKSYFGANPSHTHTLSLSPLSSPSMFLTLTAVAYRFLVRRGSPRISSTVARSTSLASLPTKEMRYARSGPPLPSPLCFRKRAGRRGSAVRQGWRGRRQERGREGEGGRAEASAAGDACYRKTAKSPPRRRPLRSSSAPCPALRVKGGSGGRQCGAV